MLAAARLLPRRSPWLLPGAASAHPLGNFTVNHLSQVRISQGSVEVHYILDQAEIPTFQEIQRFDRNGDGAIIGPERGPLLQRKLERDRVRTSRLTVDGRDVPLGSPRAARPSASRRARAVSR